MTKSRKRLHFIDNILCFFWGGGVIDIPKLTAKITKGEQKKSHTVDNLVYDLCDRQGFHSSSICF